MKADLNSFKRHLARWGPEGVLESARQLPEDEQQQLEELVKQWKGSHSKDNGHRKGSRRKASKSS